MAYSGNFLQDLPEELNKEFWMLAASAASLLYLGFRLFGLFTESPVDPAVVLILIGMCAAVIVLRTATSGSFPSWALRPLESAASWLGISIVRLNLLLMAPLLSLAAWLAAGDDIAMKLPWHAVTLWLLAIAALLGALVTGPNATAASKTRWPRWEILLLLALALIAFLLRAWNLTQIPWILAGDEASMGLSSLDYLSGSRTNIFGVAWFSFPSLYFLLPAVSIKIFGQTIAALRLPSAIAGSMTVVALYIYVRHAFGRPHAILAAAFLTFFHFHIHFSRLGINNIWDAFFVTVLSAGLWIGWRHNRRHQFLAAGLALGLGMYFYTSIRVFLIIVPLWAGIAFLLHRRVFWKRIQGFFIVGYTAFVAALPIGMFSLFNWDQFMAPVNRTSILGPWLEREMAKTGLSSFQIILSQYTSSTLAFTSSHLRHWYKIDQPMLFSISATIFTIGLLILVMRLKDLRFVWLGLWLFAAISAGALSESVPAAQRYVFVAPAVAIIATLPLSVGLGWIKSWRPVRLPLAYAAVAALLALVFTRNLIFYFDEYTQSRVFSDVNTETAQAVAGYFTDHPKDHTVYFLGHPRMGFRSLSTLPYLAPQLVGVDINEILVAPPQWDLAGPATIIILPEREPELTWIQMQYPEGHRVVFYNDRGFNLFIAYEIG